MIFYEAPSEKDAVGCALMFSEKAATETLVAILKEGVEELLRV